MAENRINMVSLLDIGLLTGTTSKIVVLGKGFSELSEDWGPDSDSKCYIDEKAASTTIKGYKFSANPTRDFITDEVQDCINTLLKKFPTGAACETYYYRFFKSDIDTTTQTGDCIKVPVTVCPASAGGTGGDTLTTGIQISGNGDPELGTITIGANESGGATYTWAKKTE